MTEGVCFGFKSKPSTFRVPALNHYAVVRAYGWESTHTHETFGEIF